MTCSRLEVLFAILLLLCLPAAGSQSPLVFSGNRIFSDQELLSHLSEKNLNLAFSTNLTSEELERAGRAIQHFYQERGYPLVRVAVHPQTWPVFQISEGPKARLGQVEFPGSGALPVETLREIFELDEYLDFNELERQLDQIRRIYRDSGFVRAETGTPVVEVVEKESSKHFPLPFRKELENRVRLIVPIREGAQYQYGKITLTPDLPELRSLLPQAGSLYGLEDLIQLRQAITGHFKEQGKLTKTVDIYQYIDDSSHQVHLQIHCSLFPALIVRRIEFRGNRRYPDSFYRRQLELQEKEVLDARKLDESLRQLQGTGVVNPLSQDDVELHVDEKLQEAEIFIDLQEKDPQRVLFSVGRDGFGGVETSFLYSVANLFGLTETLGLDLSLGSVTSELGVGLAWRYLAWGDLPASLFLRFFRRHTDFRLPGIDGTLLSLLGARQVGFSAGGSYRIRRGEELGILGTAEKLTTATSSKHFVLQPFWSKSNQQGEEEMERLEVSNRFSLFEGSIESWNLRPEFSYRRTLKDLPSPDQSVQVGFRASHAHFFRGPAPLSERLFGNAELVRGFKSPLLGPWGQRKDDLLPVGGDILLSVNLEYRFPVRSGFTVVPFADAGLVGSISSPESFELLEETNHVWRSSVGTELRVALPANLPTARFILSWNPLRLDEKVLTENGWARLRDPALSLRVGF